MATGQKFTQEELTSGVITPESFNDSNRPSEKIYFEIPPRDFTVYSADGRPVGKMAKIEARDEGFGRKRVVFEMIFQIDPVSKKTMDPKGIIEDEELDEAASVDLDDELELEETSEAIDPRVFTTLDVHPGKFKSTLRDIADTLFCETELRASQKEKMAHELEKMLGAVLAPS